MQTRTERPIAMQRESDGSYTLVTEDSDGRQWLYTGVNLVRQVQNSEDLTVIETASLPIPPPDKVYIYDAE